MSYSYKLYVCDTETTGLNSNTNEIIEVSFYRINDNQQKTWHIKPTNYEAIEPEALRINGHKIEDLKHNTAEGRKLYQEPVKAIAEIENWFNEDMSSAGDRILIAQNTPFDLGFLEKLWIQNNAFETFPFGKRCLYLDTRQIQIFIDLVKGNRSEYYNLGSLVEKYGVKKLKAHSAHQDTIMCKDVLLQQLSVFDTPKK